MAFGELTVITACMLILIVILIVILIIHDNDIRRLCKIIGMLNDAGMAVEDRISRVEDRM